MTPPRKISVRVPATTSNLGPGFDILGMALNIHCSVTVEIALKKNGPAVVENSGEGSDALPTDESHLVVSSFRKALPRSRFPHALRFSVKNEIPLARGLGSSAAARLCGLLAAAAATRLKIISPEQALARAIELEGHPDNCVPAFFGGLRACVQGRSSLRHFPIRIPPRLGLAACVPDLEVETARARRVLPKKIPLQTSVATSGRLALLLYAIESGSFGLLKDAADDVLHEPHRAKLMKGYPAAKFAAERAGAYAAFLSGSGSTVLAFGPKEPRRLAAIAEAMRRAFLIAKTSARVFPLKPDLRGALLAWK